MHLAFFSWLGACLLLASAVGVVRADDNLPLSRIGFGACAKQDQPQPIWEAIIAQKPQLFLLLGDNIYGDTQDMDVLRAKYRLFAAQPGFRQLKEICPLLATWDDHDYGANDAGADYPKRRESQAIFLDFFGVPADSPRRRQEGVYSAHVFGPPGKRVQILLLDSRYFRSPLKKGFARGEPGEGIRGEYAPDENPKSTMLGAAQWAWLEQQLREPAEVRLIGSSVQLVAEDHGWESWANFPRERERFLALVRETQAAGVILLSGDRHLAEISRLAADDEHGVGYPLFDVTSSSLNAPSGNFTPAKIRFTNEINRHRQGVVYFDVNFGFVDIDWTAADPVLRLQVRELSGAVVLQQRLTLSQLRPQ